MRPNYKNRALYFATPILMLIVTLIHFFFLLIYRHFMNITAVPALDKTFQILDLITDSTQLLTAAHIAKELNPQYFAKPVAQAYHL